MTYIRTKEIKEKISNSLKEYFKNPKVKEQLSIQNSGENNPRFGKPLSYKKRKEMHYKMLGKNNHQWKNGNGIRRYDFVFNTKFKNAIRKRDNQICMVCGIHREKLNYPLHIHHINYDKKLTIKENCCALCNSCHGKTRDNRKEWIEFFHSLLNKKYGYKYEEGLIKLEVDNEI